MSITNYLNKIKNAIRGKDVRGAIHDAIKECYDNASINHDNANMEVILARGTHDTLNERLEVTDMQLSELANKGTTVEVLERVTKEEIERQLSDGTLTNLTIEDNSITGDKIELGAIRPDKIYNTKPTGTKNLLNGVNIIQGCRYNNGVIEIIDIYSITDFIPVYAGYSYTLNKGRYSLVSVFDSKKTFIKEEKVNGDVVDYNFKIPPNGRYVVINMPNELISTMRLTNDVIGDSYIVEWLELRDKSVANNHLIDKSIELNKLSDSVFFGEKIYKYEFERASSSFENGYVVTTWFDISRLSDSINLKFSIGIKANRNNFSTFKIKAFQYDSLDEIGGEGFVSPEIPFSGDEKTFSNLSIETSLSKEKKFLKIMLWGVSLSPSLPEVIEIKEVNVYLNGEKQKVDLENLGSYGTNSIPKISEIEQLVTASNNPIVASRDWVYELFIKHSNSSANRIQGKRIGVIGDSYVYGHTLGTDKSWVTILGKRNDMIYFNYGVNGGLLSRANGVAERYKDMNDDLDYIIVFAGHNDATANVSIGSDFDETIETFKGALNVLCKGLQSRYPRARILFMTPTHRKGNEPPYCQAMKDICYKYGIQVYDTYAKLGINIGEGNEGNAQQKEVFELVPLHLNELGNEYLSYKVEAELLTL